MRSEARWFVLTPRERRALSSNTRVPYCAAARELLPQFDTGCWSLYSLDGSNASTTYHAYHVRLLRRLAALDGDPLWRQTADRWADYQRRGGC